MSNTISRIQLSVFDPDTNEMAEELQQVQQKLFQQVQDTIFHHQSVGCVIDLLLEQIENADLHMSLKDLRQQLTPQMHRLATEHSQLTVKLGETQSFLTQLMRDSKNLDDQINRIRALSLTDELTGLANRRSFLQRLENEVERAQRYGHSLSVALIDLDHFKQVNDQFGHGSGDEVLRRIATNILSAFRHSDLVSRYGGEEFAVLMPNTDLNGAIQSLCNTKTIVGNTGWMYQDRQLPMPTFSVGLALYQTGEMPENLIERADNALYRAKRLGRNRLEVDTTYGSSTKLMEPVISS